ncbi:hypothetical protein FALBO_11730 [Fusarium albosuccineum]|uniref:PNPLA domain-containing protein n=1 Tax=Fusarium albosuccineum TaxID=1237068 RepID=A0A8H4L5C1_9HYPO|nr:hypothetical protein FALBO_11730 [Fusarium albosuccineum]
MDSSSPYTTLPEVVVNAGHDPESKYRPRVPPKSPRLTNALVESMTTCEYYLRPILYADCEGMTGGEARPRGLACRDKLDNAKRPAQFVKNKLRKKITWADNPKMQSREYAVTSLFPRILYTFSDVVVFVLREVRTFQTDVLVQLVNWAAMSIDKSINQPTRPHIIIVVNATDASIEERQWDPDTATCGLLDDYQHSVYQVSALRDTLARLSMLGKAITTTKELLEYYYSSVTVVRIPAKGRYMKIDEQIGTLHNLIGTKCAMSHAQKKKIRMLLNAQMLPQYVDAAYDHFSRRLDEPFDFVEEARRHAPLPQDFSGHILNLILSMYNNYDHRRSRVKDLLMKPSRPIASCIMLDATRDNTQGTYSTLLRNTYYDPLWVALREFCDYWLRCSFEKDGQECRNAKNSHEKGHQAPTGKVLGRGDYKSMFVADDFFPVWIDEIDEHIKRLEEGAQHYDRDESALIPKTHIEVMADFYRNANPGRPASSFKSNLTCLCCVREIPENVLPCGHILCKACVQVYGDNAGQGLFRLRHCPLHPRETSWPQPVLIKFKPEEAGVRVLCLDGGGVRGIVELAILQAIEEALGYHIPIQNFFDLIVGTSTGGIIALGLGVKRWSVSDCIKHFKDLCGDAFTSRPLKTLAVVSHRSFYKTKPLERALQSAFNEHSPLYGGFKSGSSTAIRVAVTSTLATENRPVILSNYNTEGERDALPYKFIRPRDPASELKIREAARATAAAPMYFKPFVQDETMAAYTDGAVHHNCPAFVADYERRLLWRDVSDWAPDIFLSIGTGLRNARVAPQPPRVISPPSSRRARSKSPPHQLSISGLSYMWRAANTIIDDQLNCEEIWRKYHAKTTAPGQIDSVWDEGRNIRLNVEFERERPALDKVEELENTERYAVNMIKDDLRIDEVASRLVASCFYFEKIGIDYTGQYKCTGNIHCRFDEGSRDIKGLGHILRDRIQGTTFVPSFFLDENYGSEDQRQYEVPIPTETIDNMCHLGFFKLPTSLNIDASHLSSMTRLSLCLQPDGYHYHQRQGSLHNSTKLLVSISGFPRELFAQDNLSPPQPQEEVTGDGKELAGSENMPTPPQLEVPMPVKKESVLSKIRSISQLSLSPKLGSPAEKVGENWDNKETAPGAFQEHRPSMRAGRSSESSLFSFEIADDRLEADSRSRDEWTH